MPVTVFTGISPMWRCVRCGKTARGRPESPEMPHAVDPPPGWRKVWRGFGGWDWVCGCMRHPADRG